MKLSSLKFLLLVLAFAFFSCEEKKTEGLKNQNTTSTSTQAVFRTPPSFNQDSAFFYVKKQVDFGPRVPMTPPHAQCGNWLFQKFLSYGLLTSEQLFEAPAFDGKILKGRNIICSFNPKATKRILLAAHWDTRPFADHDSTKQDIPIDGANDGASGVGVLLEVARQLSLSDTLPKVGIDFILFDLEDYGEPDHKETDHDQSKVHWCLGSQYWARNLHQPGYTAYYGILLDMVGGHNATFYKEGTSLRYAPKIVELVWSTAHKLGYGNYFVNAPAKGGITDDHVFVNTLAKIPMIDIIQHDPNGDSYFAFYWHTHQDNLENVSPETLKAVGQTLLQVLWNE